MIKISVPATSANLGAGFDSLGLALGLYNTVSFEEFDGCDISSGDGSFTPKDEANLIYRTAKQVYSRCGASFKGLRMVQTNAIPMARGLGSSSACIVAGIMGANALLKSPLSREEMLDFAVELEGHPDNVAPALLGGFVVCAVENNHAYAIKKDISDELQFAAFIPSFRLLTEKARAALPKEIPHKDAVYNVSRAALCAAAFCEGRYDLLQVATGDVLHQPYRMPLIEGGEEVLTMCRELGACGAFISGAGPTLLSIVRRDNAEFYAKASARLKLSETGNSFTLRMFSADNEGAKYI
ncbi:MAG: homoserine kinase [Oscillospiraceae bacterium]